MAKESTILLLRIFCLSLLLTTFPTAIVRADQIVWGTSVSLTDVNFDSTGAPLDNSFTFALGTFGAAFDPASNNVELWASNWKVLDTAAYNPTYDYFTSATDLTDNSVFAAGEKAYIWIYNNQAAVPGSEWLLVHGVDRNAVPWAIPTAPGNQTAFPLEFRISNVTNTLFGGVNNVQGPGEFTSTPTSFTLQTHTFTPIPEPGTAGLLAGGLLGLLRRRRTLPCRGEKRAELPCQAPEGRGKAAKLHLGSVSRLAVLAVGGAFLSNPAGTARGHNLDQLDTSIAFDKATLDLMASRAGLSQSLIQAGDSIGLILKSTPGPGTATGAGGYMTFYIPPGTQVEKAEYGRPTTSGSFTAIPMKGPSIMATGDGSVGSATTAGLIGLTLGPNAGGQTAGAVSAGGVHNGTLAGVYGDTGIFYSVDPKTVWQSFVNTGGYDRNPGTVDNTLTNNRGESRVPINKWDAEQLIGLGLSAPAPPILDPNGRGNTPWGVGSAVAGPQSGYQWAFDRDYYLNNPGDPARMKNAIVTGPWNRIKYPGSTLAKDQPGLKSTVLGYATVDASTLGTTLTAGSPLAPTLNWTDPTSPKAVRFSYGGLVLGQSEYARVQLKILAAPGQPNSPFDANGCFFMNTDTFGGDAGGEQGGKDHLWRYYDPTVQTINPCAMLQKQFAKTLLAPGETSWFELVVINTGTTPMTNVVITDPMPAGLSYVSAIPAPSATSPLTFTLGTVPSQGVVRIRVNVTGTGTGTIFNTATMTSSAGTTTAMDSVEIGVRSILEPTKSVTPSASVPGGTVTYTVTISNIGTGTNGTPLVLTDVLPAGFSYSGLVSAQLNGAAAAPGSVTVSAADPAKPVFTVSQGIQAGKSLVINMTALISATQAAGTYGNSLSMKYESKVVTSGSLAPVTVGGARLGDTIWRDWDNDGLQDPDEEGVPGMMVQLYAADGTTLLRTTTTDASGHYGFVGLTAGTYVIKAGPPAGYTQTFDGDGLGTANQSTVTLALNENNSAQDFGYLPGGTGSIGDAVFEDLANDGALSPGDSGIPGITVNLYEDSNGNGTVDPGDSLIATTATNGSGAYLFSGLATGLDYVARVDAADPDLPVYFAPDSYQASTPASQAVANLTGAHLTADFGFWQVQPGSIGDQVFSDADGDGVYSAGVDSPLVGVVVHLDLDGVPAGSATSAADGTYLFANIGPGNYRILVDPLSTGVPSGYSPSVSQYAVTLAPGQNFLSADFPFAPLISKTVDKSYVQTGQTLTFGVNVDYAGSRMLDNVSVRDFVPAGTTSSSVGQGGSLLTFSPAAGVPGTDAGSPGGATVAVTAPADIEDAWLDENSPANNYGGTTDLRVDPETGRPEHALVRFTLPAGIPADAVVTSATLKLTKLSGNTIDIVAHQADNAWTELQAGWADRQTATPWDTAGGDFIEDPADPVVSSGTATGDRTWQVGPIVQNWLAGQANHGFLLKHPVENLGNNANSFASSEHGTAASRPTLTITYTSTARPATSNTIAAVPNVAAVGLPITVTMTVQSSEAAANVVPSGLQVYGGSATVSGPVPASINLAANTPAVFTWTVIPTGVAELSFAASAGNGIINFMTGTSNSVLASPGGQSQYVTWTLGSNDPGTSATTATTKYLYAFRGADALDFWTLNTATGAWNNPLNPADTPSGVTIKEGASLTNDGVRYIYALRGDATRVFLRYDTSTNAWDDAGIADLPGTTDKTVLKGGSLVYLNGFVYAFIGNDSLQFWRYSVAGNVWTQMASAPGTVNNGAGLTTDGTNLYATQGDGKKGFWRYNVAGNTWTALRPFADNFGDGGSLVYANGAIYVLRGGGQKTFRRYNIPTDSWTTLAPALANIDDGAAMAFDGACIYVLAGKTNLFHHYLPATNSWVALTNTPAVIGWGGALTFLPVGNVSLTVASASPTFVTGVSQIAVQMTVTSENVINNITPVAPGFTANNGITATFGPPTLVSSDDDIAGTGDAVIYQWIATVTPGTLPGEITFTPGSSMGVTARTNSVIVSPVLTFVATVNGSPPPVIENTAFVADSSGTLPSTPSNTTQTATGASIGDYVWADLDGDGIQDSGEPGLSGVRVFIDQDADGNYDPGEKTDVTDSNGLYRIFGLTAGTYPVTMDVTSLPVGYQPTTVSPLSVVLATNSTQYTAADFGLRPSPVLGGTLPSSIGDTLWIDANEDGVVDGGETLLTNVTVRIHNDVNNNGAIDGGDLLLGVRTTDAGGKYLFADLYSGNYLVEVNETDPDLPGGIELVSGGANGAGLHDVTLGTGINQLTADFGYNYSGSIGDYVWYDLNGDRIQNNSTGEIPVPNAVVTLYDDTNNNGALEAGEPILRFTTTNASGIYLFDNLPAGNYLVKVEEQEVPAPPSSPFAGQPARMQASTGTTKAVALAPGQTFVSADFGFLEVAKVEGHVFHDANGNGILDPGETILPNVTVTLTGTDGNGAPVSLTTTTGSAGGYKFLPPSGTYTVACHTADPDIPAALGTRTTPVSFLFSIASGNEVENLDFGLDNTGSIGDTVFANPNSNVTQDSGEPGLANVVVNLYTDAARTLLLDSKVTDASGKYLFSGLADGTYYTQMITTTLPAIYIATPTADPDATKDSLGTAIVSGGGAVLTQDFGYTAIVPTFAVSGTLFHDLNTSGAPNVPGEQLTGVTLTAAVDTNTDGTVDQTFTTTTDGNGLYTFAGIPGGSNVTFTVSPATLGSPAFVQTVDPDVLINNTTSITNLTADVNGQNFGYVLSLGSIAGAVVRGNGNGLAELGEPAQANVTVTLTYAGIDGIEGNGDDQTFTTPTDASGAYSFTGLLPGNYSISTTPPAAIHPLADRDGTNPNSIALVLGVGQNTIGQDFEYQSSAISGRVLADANNDNTGDDPIGGVSLSLTDSGGIPVDNPHLPGLQAYVTTTAPDGTYGFTGLPSGSYRVVQVQPAAYLNVRDLDSTADAVGSPADPANTSALDNTIPVLLALGETDDGNDFVERLPGTISGFVLEDTNNDTTGDAPIANVILTLKTGAGADMDSDPNTPGVQPTITTTAPDGSYSFTGLRPGSYQVAETQPSGYLSISDVDGGNPDLIGDNTLIAVTTGTETSGRNFTEKAVKHSTFTAWKTWNGLSGSDGLPVPDAGGNGGNPDTDVYSNLLEYAFCFPPKSGVNLRCAGEIRITPGGRIDYALTMATGLTDVTLGLETAGSLGGPTVWSAAPGLASTLTDNLNGTSTLVYEDIESLGAAYADGDGFVRVRVGLDTSGDSVPDVFDFAPVSGWTDHTHAGNLSAAIPDQCTTFSMPYLKCPIISGAAGGNTALSIDLTAAAGGASVAGALSYTKRYFVEITGGSLEGHRFEVNVAGSSPTSLALKAVSRVNTAVLTAGALTGAPLVVRELWTYQQLFPPATFLAGSSSSDSDTLLVHTGTAWKSYFLADLGAVRQWVLAGDAGLVDQGSEILEPGEGLFVHRRGPSLTIARHGLVRTNAFAKPLPGAAWTLVGSGYPMDQTYTSRVMTVAAGFKGDVDLLLASQVLFWEGDTVPGRMSYNTDFLLDAGSNPLRYWTSGDDSFLANKDSLPLFDGTSAAFYVIPLALPNYVVPPQWYSAP